MGMNKTLGVEPCIASEHMKTLSKLQDMADLQARVDCLLKENGKLKAKLAARKAELADTWKKKNKAVEVAQKFQEYVGNSDAVVNKAKLYDKGMLPLGLAPGPKIIWFLVDYAAKMEH